MANHPAAASVCPHHLRVHACVAMAHVADVDAAEQL
jgi:hypothetical protein